VRTLRVVGHPNVELSSAVRNGTIVVSKVQNYDECNFRVEINGAQNAVTLKSFVGIETLLNTL
jgi:hypothetical protein